MKRMRSSEEGSGKSSLSLSLSLSRSPSLNVSSGSDSTLGSSHSDFSSRHTTPPNGGAGAGAGTRPDKTETETKVRTFEASTSIAAYRRLIGSITRESVNDADVMKQIETWPASRQTLLIRIQEKLEPMLMRYERRLPVLGSVFNDIKSIGDTGEYGEVYSACIKASDTDAAACWKLPGSDDRSFQLVVKTIRKPKPARQMTPCYAGHCERRGWVGHLNPYREILMGRLLNRLVRKNITPHFPMVYESFEVLSLGAVGFAMETCDIGFTEFAENVINRVKDDASRVKLFRIAVLQLTHALIAGQQHFDFRHNDFHAGNAMMTLITNSAYAYKFSADEQDAEDTFYQVPNAGMCWKLIDFGFSSSSVFCAEDNSTNFTTSKTLCGMVPTPKSRVYFPGKEQALEMYDLLRFLHYVIDLLQTRRFAGKDTLGSLRFFSGLRDHVEAISAASPKRGTLMAVSMVNAWWTPGTLTAEEFEDTYISSSGLLQKFFKALAQPFKLKTAEEKRRVLESGHVFNTDAHPFSPNEVLTGLEAGHFTVGAAGELVALSDELWVK